MRGAGKTSVGRALAKELAWNFLDLDDVLEEQQGSSCREVVQALGWKGFRQVEQRVLARALAAHPQKTVISCGGGIVESPKARKRLQSHWPVIHLNRAISDVLRYLEGAAMGGKSEDKGNNGTSHESSADAVVGGGTERRPNYGESTSDVWKRREPFFRSCSSHEFTVVENDSDWQSIDRDFADFVRRIQGKPQMHLVAPHTSFVCLTFGDLTQACADGRVERICSEHDCVELRVDLLDSYEPNFIHAQLAKLRRFGRKPIIFTIRTEKEGGRFPNEERAMFELLEVGLRSACELVDVEVMWSKSLQKQLANHARSSQPHAAFIGSVHIVREPLRKYSEDELAKIFARTNFDPSVALCKVVARAESEADALRIHNAGRNALDTCLELSKASVCAMCTTPAGSLSRIFNCTLGSTPVTHPDLPSSAAPGQLTLREI